MLLQQETDNLDELPVKDNEQGNGRSLSGLEGSYV